jgi:tetratricopeptide (TPR) repeat protein
LPHLAEAVGGWHLNEKALLVPVDHQWEALNKVRARFSADTNDRFARWGAWILANSENRRTSPFSEVEAQSPSPAASPPIIPSPPISAPAGKESSEHMLFLACFQHGLFSFAGLKEPAFALESYERALPLAKNIAAAQPENFQAQKDLYLVHTFMSECYAALKQTDKALSSSLEALHVIEKAAQRKPDPEMRKLLWEAWNDVSYYQIINRQPQDAINSAIKGLEQDPTQTLTKANLVDAYLLTGQYEKAEPILLEIKDIKASDKQTYADVILKSFDELKKLGIEHPDTQKARALLGRPTPSENK